MNTQGNTILITGGTSGIGLAFAEEFYNRNNKVIICGRRTERLHAIKQRFPGIETFRCDISDTTECKELFEQVSSRFPAVNILINNAGIQLSCDIAAPVDLTGIRAEIDTNLIAPLYLSSLFIPKLKTQENSAIINITSGLAFVPISFMPVYCATKAALHSVCLSLRHQLRNTSVKVFEIAPPATDTELGHQQRQDNTRSHGGIPVKEFLMEAMQAIEDDVYEACVGQAKALKANAAEMFYVLNR